IDGGTTYQPGTTFTVNAGTYTVTVKDASNCVQSSAQIGVSEPALLVAGGSGGGILFNGGTTTLTATANGGTSPYQYSIDGGTTYQPGTTLTGNARTPHPRGKGPRT